ncbi:hypothetical protein GCM10010520_23390 [Rhizobium viscosum]
MWIMGLVRTTGLPDLSLQGQLWSLSQQGASSRVSVVPSVKKQEQNPLQPCLTGEVWGSKGKGIRRRAHKRSASGTAPLPARGATPLRVLLLTG